MVGGGNHFDGAGGYSGGGAEVNSNPGYNGSGGGINSTGVSTGGGGYFTAGKGIAGTQKGSGKVGGMSGSPLQANSNTTWWYKDVCGNGGKAGAGGTIIYSKLENIFAYNGDMITNGDYSTAYYEYNKDGTITTNALEVLTRTDINGNEIKFIPTKIFAQSGIIRETYTTNTGVFTLNKVKTGETLPEIATSYDTTVVVKATNEQTTETTGYTNGYMTNQGIGSGAGYLETSNGSFTLLNK